MLLKFDSFIRQIKFEKEYRGNLTINDTKFNYRVTFSDLIETEGKPKFRLKVELFDKRWSKISLDSEVEDFLKARAANNVIGFYEAIKEYNLGDGILGGVFKPENWNGKPYENIENRLTWLESESKDLPRSMDASKFRKILSRYHK